MIIQLLTILIIVAFLALIWPEIPAKRAPRIILIILGGILILYTAFRDGNLVRDYNLYEWMYTDEIFLVEPTFTLISFIVRNWLGDQIIFLFLIYALIAISLKLKAIRQLTSLVFFSILIYLSDFFILHELTQMRAAVATGILLLSIKPLYERKGKQFFFLILCGALFHLSSIPAFFLWWLKPDRINKTRWLIFLVIAYALALVHFDLFQLVTYIPISFIQDRVATYLALQENEPGGANIFSLLFLGKLAITLLLLWKAQLIALYNRYIYILLKVMFVSFFSLLLFSSNLAAGLRFNEFFGTVSIVLFPLLYYTIKQKYLSWLILVFIAAMFFYIRVFKFELILSA